MRGFLTILGLTAILTAAGIMGADPAKADTTKTITVINKSTAFIRGYWNFKQRTNAMGETRSETATVTITSGNAFSAAIDVLHYWPGTIITEWHPGCEVWVSPATNIKIWVSGDKTQLRCDVERLR